MNVLNMVMIGLVAFTIIYMILKAIAVCSDRRSEYEEPEQITYITEIEIEIKSRDLYVKAENLIATNEVYALQAEQLLREIERIDDKLTAEKRSPVRDNAVVQKLISQSLKLQEKKCNIEAKMIRINSELDKIAREEYRRQTLEDSGKNMDFTIRRVYVYLPSNAYIDVEYTQIKCRHEYN